ncbi:MAG: PD40 domain-containing protein [Anaerolineales bacterium]|nr:PD40 domain-containing protein [Anaerolineales bacterium]
MNINADRNTKTDILLVSISLLLTAACTLTGFFGYPDDGTLAALSTENAALSTQVAVQDAMLATQAADAIPSEENRPDTQEGDDPTSDLEITGSYPSPDESCTALILEEFMLVLEKTSGERQILHETRTITGLSWFPDGSALAVSEVIDDPDSPLLVRDRLLVIDTGTGEYVLLADGFAPAVSPDGQWIAFYEGIHYGDACSVGWRLAFLRLDSSGNIKQTLHQEDFAGLPESSDEGTFYPSPNDTPSNPGVWEGALQFESFLRYACAEDPADDGVYRFNLDTLTVEKTGSP